ncbi:MAG: MarC family protein [Candidatus Omnitrophica bacterium]|nr:MarC family protein [Candidatus Omnitrophota bacterium]
MFRNYFLAFVPIFVAVDALGTLPLFIALTDGLSSREKKDLIRHSTLTALLVAIIFLWVGRLVFAWLGITINDFFVAGGAILFIISIRDLLAYSKETRMPFGAMGAVPLAVPLIVGPAVLTTSLILLSSFGLFPTLFSIVANILLCGLVLSAAEPLSGLLGRSGSHTLSKISNLLLAAIGVMLMRMGLVEIFRAFK